MVAGLAIAARLGLGCIPMGLPYPWQIACLGSMLVGVVLVLATWLGLSYLPMGLFWPWGLFWLCTHWAALATATCMPWSW